MGTERACEFNAHMTQATQTDNTDTFSWTYIPVS
jgi:hypothetical protein